MHLTCPNCQTAVELMHSESAVDLPSASVTLDFFATTTCPKCHSHLSVVSPPSPSPSLPARMTIGHYELIERLGQGQSAMVWKARDTELNRIVAIKIPRTLEILEQGAELFLKEAQAIATLDHPNIVRLYGVERDVDVLMIVTEFVAGITLQKHLQAGRLPHRESARICQQLAEALQHAHERGVVHRDIKPGNVLINAQGQLKITDFGLAKRDAADITMTLDGQILGTPAYMSPEQARGLSQSTDCRSDVYSLGVVLYEMLTGCLPFSGTSRLILDTVIHGDARPPRKLDPSIPKDLETICLKAMSADPTRRYHTAGELAADLRSFLDGNRIQAQRSGIVEKGWKWTRRHPWQLATALSVVAAILALSATSSGAKSTVETRMISLDTEPSNAELVFVECDPITGEPIPEAGKFHKAKSKAILRLPVGRYYVSARLHDGRFHEVFRRIPAVGTSSTASYNHEASYELPDGILRLPNIEIPSLTVADKMALFPGSERFTMGDARIPDAPPYDCSIPAFYLDPREVTVGEFIANKTVPPASWSPKAKPPSDEMAVSKLFFDEVISYAEQRGKRLMTEAEYEFAATYGGSRAYPWGDQEQNGEWTIENAGQPAVDVLPTQPPVFGLFSNVGELTSTWGHFYPSSLLQGGPDSHEFANSRIVRGAPLDVCLGIVDDEIANKNVQKWTPRNRLALDRNSLPKNVGFRMARSAHPRFTPEDFERVLSRQGK